MVDDVMAPRPVVRDANAALDSVRLVMSIEEAGAMLGLQRGAAYGAAKRGQLPTVRFGRRLLVPVQKLAELLGVAT
jgi:excisionase family DNA binding protein